MPLLEETTLPQEHPPTVPVIIIGKCFALNLLIFNGFTLLPQLDPNHALILKS